MNNDDRQLLDALETQSKALGAALDNPALLPDVAERLRLLKEGIDIKVDFLRRKLDGLLN